MSSKKSDNGHRDTIETYKGFNKDFSCRGHQYEIGKTYTHDSPVRCVESRYDSCEMPLDAWTYYGPATSRYAVVIASGQIDSVTDGDSEITSTELTIQQELKLPDLIEAASRWIMDRARSNTATGYCGRAVATGYGGHAAATGYGGRAVAAGDGSHAAATGYGGRAVAAGEYSHAVAAGSHGHVVAAGDFSHAAAAGNYGHAVATGCRGHASATGYGGRAVAAGDGSHATVTGAHGHAVATGNGSHAVTTGESGNAMAAGDYTHAMATGRYSIAAALGHGCTAAAGPDGWIVLSRWSGEGELEVRAAKVGTEGIEPGKRYRLTAAGFEEAD